MINLARRLLKGALAFSAVRDQAISGHSTSTQNDAGIGAALDGAGNFLFLGYTDAANDVGWLAKFDADMALLWQRKQSLTARFRNPAAAPRVDSSDNVYVMGQGYVTAAPELPMLFKYNSAGTLQWQRQLTDASSSNIKNHVLDASGNSYFCLGVAVATEFAIVAKYNNAGAIQWQRKLSSTYQVATYDLTFASDGGILVVGGFKDGGAATADFRGFIIKYTTAGAVSWQYKIHWGAQGAWNCLAVDSVTGDIYLGGQYSAAAVLTGAITKLNSSGTHQWTRRHPTSNTFINALAVDTATGNVYAYLSDTTTIVTCFDASGTVLWERQIAGDASAAVTIRGRSALAVVGSELWISCEANHTGASKGGDAVLLRMPLAGGNAATCGYIVISIPTATAFTTPSAPTNVAAGLTDAAGTSTDAAGTATDAAGAMTFTTYTS